MCLSFAMSTPKRNSPSRGNAFYNAPFTVDNSEWRFSSRFASNVTSLAYSCKPKRTLQLNRVHCTIVPCKKHSQSTHTRSIWLSFNVVSKVGCRFSRNTWTLTMLVDDDNIRLCNDVSVLHQTLMFGKTIFSRTMFIHTVKADTWDE